MPCSTTIYQRLRGTDYVNLPGTYYADWGCTTLHKTSHVSTRIHGITSLNTAFLTVHKSRTSNLTFPVQNFTNTLSILEFLHANRLRCKQTAAICTFSQHFAANTSKGQTRFPVMCINERPIVAHYHFRQYSANGTVRWRTLTAYEACTMDLKQCSFVKHFLFSINSR